MALLAPLAEYRASSSPSVSLSSGDPALVGMFGGSASNSAQIVNADTALAISTVFACVTRKAKTLAMIPLEVQQNLPNGGQQAAPYHRLYWQLRYKPNRWQTSYDYRLMIHGHVQLRGNGYSRIISSPGRGINELIPLHPDRVWPFIVTPSGVIQFMYDTSPPPPAGSKLFYQHFPINGENEIFPEKDILHIRGFSSNGIVGMGVIKKLMRESIGLAMATEEHGARLFSNGAQISKVFKHPGSLSDPAYDRLKKELDNNFNGVSNAHKTIILEDGMTVEGISLTNRESQFIEARKFQAEDICSFLDVPMILINRSGDKNQTFASAQEIIAMFINHQMYPDFVNWEQVLNKDLLYESEKREYEFKFDFDALLRADQKGRGEYLLKRFQTGSMSPDEIRVYEGEIPTGTPEGKKYYLQSGMMPIDMAAKAISNNIKGAINNSDTEPNEGDDEPTS
jgi:HK97 family phage portal protein